MRKIILCALLLGVVFCPIAPGAHRDLAKLYLTLGPHSGVEGGTQLWRCSIDGTEPELLLEDTMLGAVDVDSVHGFLYYTHGSATYRANLDASDPQGCAYGVTVCDIGWGLCPFDAEMGYFCRFAEYCFETAAPDGSISWAYFTEFPGVVPTPVAVGVAVYVPPPSGVDTPESTSWGMIKSSFR